MEIPKQFYSRKFRKSVTPFKSYQSCLCSCAAINSISFDFFFSECAPPTGVLLIFFGKGMCNWSKQTRRRRKRYNGDESYLCSQIYLLGSANSKWTTMNTKHKKLPSHINSNLFSRRRLYSAAWRLHVHIRDDTSTGTAQQPNRWTRCHWIQYIGDRIPARQHGPILWANIHRCEAIRFEHRSSVTGIQRFTARSQPAKSN